MDSDPNIWYQSPSIHMGEVVLPAVQNDINSMAVFQQTMNALHNNFMAETCRIQEYRSKFPTVATPTYSGPWYALEDPTLPSPWKGLIDGSSGSLYYWNPETNHTQYERPSPPTPLYPPTFTSSDYSIHSNPQPYTSVYHHSITPPITHPYRVASIHPNPQHQSHNLPINYPHSEPIESFVSHNNSPYKATIISESTLSSTYDSVLGSAPTTKKLKSLRVNQNLRTRSNIKMKRKPSSKPARCCRTRFRGDSAMDRCDPPLITSAEPDDLGVPVETSPTSVPLLMVATMIGKQDLIVPLIKDESILVESKKLLVTAAVDLAKVIHSKGNDSYHHSNLSFQTHSHTFAETQTSKGSVLALDGLWDATAGLPTMMIKFKSLHNLGFVPGGCEMIRGKANMFADHEQSGSVHHFPQSLLDEAHISQVTIANYGLQATLLSQSLIGSPVMFALSPVIASTHTLIEFEQSILCSFAISQFMIDLGAANLPVSLLNWKVGLEISLSSRDGEYDQHLANLTESPSRNAKNLFIHMHEEPIETTSSALHHWVQSSLDETATRILDQKLNYQQGFSYFGIVPVTLKKVFGFCSELHCFSHLTAISNVGIETVVQPFNRGWGFQIHQLGSSLTITSPFEMLHFANRHLACQSYRLIGPIGSTTTVIASIGETCYQLLQPQMCISMFAENFTNLSPFVLVIFDIEMHILDILSRPLFGANSLKKQRAMQGSLVACVHPSNMSTIYRSATKGLLIPHANLFLILCGTTPKNIHLATLTRDLWSVHIWKEIDPTDSYYGCEHFGMVQILFVNIVVNGSVVARVSCPIHTVACALYKHHSMVVEAAIILRYISLPPSSLDMLITDVSGGNLSLVEVGILHFLCQAKPLCHPRRFIVDEVIDLLKSNSQLSFLRYSSDALLSRDNCVGFVTNMHKFFQYMVGHFHKDEFFMATCSSTIYPPFHALVKKLFLLSPMVAIHSLRPLLADILREDTQFIFGLMMVVSMNELMFLWSKKQGLAIGYSDIDNGHYCSSVSCSLHLPNFMITWFFEFTPAAIDFGDLALIPPKHFSVSMLSNEAPSLILLFRVIYSQAIEFVNSSHLLQGPNREALRIFSNSHLGVHLCTLMHYCIFKYYICLLKQRMEFPWNYMPHNEIAVFLIWIIEASSGFKEQANIDTTLHTTVGAFDATRTRLEFGAHMRNTNSAARMISFSECPSEAMWLPVDVIEAQYMGKLGIWLVIASGSYTKVQASNMHFLAREYSGSSLYILQNGVDLSVVKLISLMHISHKRTITATHALSTHKKLLLTCYYYNNSTLGHRIDTRATRTCSLQCSSPRHEDMPSFKGGGLLGSRCVLAQ